MPSTGASPLSSVVTCGDLVVGWAPSHHLPNAASECRKVPIPCPPVVTMVTYPETFLIGESCG